MQDKLEDYRLQSERRMLYEKLRRLEYRARYAPVAPPDLTAVTAGIDETREHIRRLEDRLMAIHPVTPVASLAAVSELFELPEQYVRLIMSRLKLDKMGIVVDTDSSRPCNNLDLIEVEIGEQPPRVITLARFGLNEFSPQDNFPAYSSFS